MGGRGKLRTARDELRPTGRCGRKKKSGAVALGLEKKRRILRQGSRPRHLAVARRRKDTLRSRPSFCLLCILQTTEEVAGALSTDRWQSKNSGLKKKVSLREGVRLPQGGNHNGEN